MSKLKNWSFRDLCKFLEAYGFVLGYINGSHHFYNGSINGSQRVVQAILSSKERQCQTNKTMNMAVRHTGIERNILKNGKRRGLYMLRLFIKTWMYEIRFTLAEFLALYIIVRD